MTDIPCKIVGADKYIHLSSLKKLTDDELSLIEEALIRISQDKPPGFNIVRIHKSLEHISLLNYPLFDEPFPVLKESWRVDLETGEIGYRTYEHSLNPPILHRKELLLPEDHPRYQEYKTLTETAESIGLFDEPTKIGYQRQWFQLINDKGYHLDGHQLLPLGNDESELEEISTGLHDGWEASRHLTAMVRYGFSAPIQALARSGYLDGSYNFFDYGCGRGSDVKGLEENGLKASGWDPYYASENDKRSADIVNLGFVINVIESMDERIDALLGAYSLADQLLVVSVMLENSSRADGKQFRDGVMTQRGTFQKYYTQGEIRQFIEDVLDEEAIAVAPGIHYIFKDKDAEQRFLSNRFRSRKNQLRRPSSATPEQIEEWKRKRADKKYEEYREPLERLWMQWITLGRKPDKSECDDLAVLTEGFTTFNKALRFIEDRKDPELLERAAQSRIEDLEVYFALNLFESRKPYKHMERGLQLDIKTFFGNYTMAQVVAKDLMFKIADTELIRKSCEYAATHGYGYLEEGESLQLHTSMVEELPAVLRVYIGCASVLYGDYRNSDLVKVHINSGKVTLMLFDDFEGKPLPKMVERVKIKLREQDLDYFEYGDEYQSPYLYHKSRYINEEFDHYPEQVSFEESLSDIGDLDLSGFGPSVDELDAVLKKHRREIDGFTLSQSSVIPQLDDHCGNYFLFRDFIECGETQAETGIANLPKQLESYNALYDLAVHLIDPVMDYFGMVKLTYGFCSPELVRKIPGRIDPKRDQHAAHEVNLLGNLVCERLGAACDLIVEDESMLEVAQWIVDNTEFDRLYYYGDALPIHVSYGPERNRQIVMMTPSKAGRLVPRVIKGEKFLGM